MNERALASRFGRKNCEKPHLWRVARYSANHEFWQCIGRGAGGHGGTPKEAYRHWRFATAVLGEKQ